jgi:peptide/nickel transport system permease protein
MMPVILWTDALIFLLIAVVMAAALWVRRRPHLMLPWQRVAGSRVGMVSLMVLGVFLVVGLLDSLHYRPALPDRGHSPSLYSPEVLSAFDYLVGDLRTQTEKTYSAPLAAYLYARETIESPDGAVSREYPRLKFGGAHLADPARQLAGDVARRAGQGALAGGLAGLLLCLAGLAVMRYLTRQPGAPGRTFFGLGRDADTARTLLLAAWLLAAVIGAVAHLAAAYHVLGTDKVGQDVLYLSLKSIRTGLVIGTVTTLVMLPFALFLGVAAGYFRGWVDDVIQYLYTVLSSIPGVLLIAAAVLMMQVVIEQHADWFTTAAERADVRLLALCLILGVTSWTGLCRLLRGETLKLRELEYIQAAQAFGVSSLRILSRHIVPNVMHIVLISVVMDFSGLVLAEAVLSYVGVGVDPSTISFGTMINAARLEMGREPMVWWTLASAFSFMLVLVLAANLFADAVRDAFDPRLNRTA